MSGYIAGWFSDKKIVRLFLCPDIQKLAANIQSRADRGYGKGLSVHTECYGGQGGF